MHHGIDYVTPTGTGLTIDGKYIYLNDAGGGNVSN